MPITRRLAVAALALPSLARAQDKTIRMLVGYPAGGAVDVVARDIAEGMRSSGYNVVVENRAGAAGRMATAQVLQAPADGNTLLCMPGGNATIFPHVYRNLGYDPLAALTPLGTACSFSFGLGAGPGTPATSLQAFVEWAKANPDKAAFGTPGGGTAMHFLGVMLGRAAGIEFLHIPYKGGAAAIVDVIGGQVPTLMTTLPNLVNPHQQGKVRILAFSGERSLASLPGVPTFAEAGYPDLTMSEVFAFFVRSGTAAPAVASLSNAITASARSERVRQALRKLEFEPLVLAPEALEARLRQETARWRRVVAESGYKATD
jgi:tripartite-type tricarboxylate transporter receptor subunit TctC